MREALTKDRKSKAGCLRFLVKFEVIAEYLGMPKAVKVVSSMRGESGVEASRTEGSRSLPYAVDQALLGGQSPALTPSTTIQDPSNGYWRPTTSIICTREYLSMPTRQRFYLLNLYSIERSPIHHVTTIFVIIERGALDTHPDWLHAHPLGLKRQRIT